MLYCRAFGWAAARLSNAKQWSGKRNNPCAAKPLQSRMSSRRSERNTLSPSPAHTGSQGANDSVRAHGRLLVWGFLSRHLVCGVIVAFGVVQLGNELCSRRGKSLPARIMHIAFGEPETARTALSVCSILCTSSGVRFVRRHSSLTDLRIPP